MTYNLRALLSYKSLSCVQFYTYTGASLENL